MTRGVRKTITSSRALATLLEPKMAPNSGMRFSPGMPLESWLSWSWMNPPIATVSPDLNHLVASLGNALGAENGAQQRDAIQPRNAVGVMAVLVLDEPPDRDRVSILNRNLRAERTPGERGRADTARRCAQRSADVLIDHHGDHAARIDARRDGQGRAGAAVAHRAAEHVGSA